MPDNDERKDAKEENPQQAEPAIKTAQEARDAASEILRPDLHAKEAKFLNHTVKVRPLPAFYSKRIHEIMRPIQEKCDAYVQKHGVPAVDAETVPEADLALDEELFQAWIETLLVMAKYYELDDVDESRLLKEMSMDDMSVLMTMQVEVSGRADFMLRPLKNTLVGLKALEKLDEKAMAQLENLSDQSFTSSLPSQKPGGQTP